MEMQDEADEQISAIGLGGFEPLVFDDSAAESSAETVDSRPTPISAELSIDRRTAALVQLANDGTPVAVRALERPFYSIGRGNCKIRIDDPRVSRFHLSLVRLGTRWVVINRTEKKSMQIGGWNLRQKTLSAGDAIRIGETWLVFVPAANDETVTTEAGMRPAESAALTDVATLGSLDDEHGSALLILRSGSREVARTSGSMLMIGAHDSCSTIVGGPGAAPFRSFISWTTDGPIIVSLGLPILLNGRPVNRALLAAGSRLQIDDTEFRVEVSGSLQAPACARLARIRLASRTAALTSFYGPHQGASWSLTPGQWVTIGRNGSCGIALSKDLRLAGIQVEIVAVMESLRNPQMRPIVRLRQTPGERSTLINRGPFDGTASATIGDVIQFGTPNAVAPTALLLHYPLSSDSWMIESKSP